jgi:2,4-dienoyl-CoA reductase (NADPH2)
MENDIIFQPLRFRNLEIKNRLLRSSISGMFDDYNGHGSNARVNWEEICPGGIGRSSRRLRRLLSGVESCRYATIDDDNKIGFWAGGEAGSPIRLQYILQLSHPAANRIWRR